MTSRPLNTTGMSRGTQKVAFSILAVLLTLVALICATGGLVGLLIALLLLALVFVCVAKARAAWHAS